MYIPLVFLSLIGFCVAGLFGRHIGPKGSAIITSDDVKKAIEGLNE